MNESTIKLAAFQELVANNKDHYNVKSFGKVTETEFVAVMKSNSIKDNQRFVDAVINNGFSGAFLQLGEDFCASVRG